MYPVIKALTVLVKARFRSPITISEPSVINLRAGITDIDMFMELNNARHLTIMELGRWDFSQRVGVVKLLKTKKWGLVVGGASVRFRRRIPFWSRYTMTTQLLCHDGRWFYFLQETHRQGQICSSGLIKAGVTAQGGLVDAPIVIEAMGQSDTGLAMKDWVQAWIDAEGQRPWPESAT